MAPEVVPVKRLKRGNVATSKEGEIVVKEEIKEEIEDDICAVVQRELFSEANDQQHVELQPETDNSYLAGNLVHVTIKEEEEDDVTILNPPPTSNPSTKPNPYQCRLCLATFSDSQKTLEHIRDHGNGKSHPCLTCHQAFYSVTELRHHQQQLKHQQAPVPSPEAQTERPYSCTVCRRTFRLSVHLSNHQLTHTKYEQTKETAKDLSTEPPKPPSPAVFLCEICCKTFPNQEHLIAHQKSHLEHLHSTSSCTLCGELFPSESDLNEHLIVHRKANLTRETIKEKEGTTGSSSSPTKPNPFQCRLCLASFSDSRTTLAHIRSHSTYPKTVKSPDHPATHQFALKPSTETTVNAPKKVPLPKPSPAAVLCEVCFKAFPNQESLIDHQKSHLDLHSRYPCTLCGELFSSESDLNEHLIIHRSSSRPPKVPFYSRPPRKPRPKPEKPLEPSTYPCPHCSRTYANKKTHSVHLREKHPPPGTERKPKLKRFFLCDLCQQEKGSSLNFSSSSSLANHKRSIHSGKRPYKCTLCDYDCARSDSMTKHMKKHAGEKSFKPIPCTLCPRIFTMRSRLASHLTDDHEAKEQWKCKLCGKLYGTRGGLKRHRTWEHQGGTGPESGSEPDDDDDETEEED